MHLGIDKGSEITCISAYLVVTCAHALYYVVEPDPILNLVTFHPHSSLQQKQHLIIVTVAKYILCN